MELEEHVGAPSISLTIEKQQSTENKYTNRLFERIIDRNNLNEAFKRVRANKGSHGVDGMKVDELLQYLKKMAPAFGNYYWKAIINLILMERNDH